MKLQYRTHNCGCGEPCPRSGREAGNKPLPYRELEAALSEMQACHAGEAEKVNRLKEELHDEAKTACKYQALSDQSEAAIQRVRDIHHKITHTRGDGVIESFCSECLDYPRYPCKTIAELDQGPGRP